MSQGIEQVSGACPHRWAALDVIKKQPETTCTKVRFMCQRRNAVGTMGVLVFQSPIGKP